MKEGEADNTRIEELEKALKNCADELWLAPPPEGTHTKDCSACAAAKNADTLLGITREWNE